MKTLILTVALTGAVRAATLYDFTGHWVGDAASRGQHASVTADFATTTSPRFSGPLEFAPDDGNPWSCTATGRQRGNRVIISMPCSDGRHMTFRGRVDPTGKSISGPFVRTAPGKSPRRGTFTLTKQA
jgi:hypothetical protein